MEQCLLAIDVGREPATGTNQFRRSIMSQDRLLSKAGLLKVSSGVPEGGLSHWPLCRTPQPTAKHPVLWHRGLWKAPALLVDGFPAAALPRLGAGWGHF